MEKKWKLPEYIGHPGYQYTPDGADDNELFKKKLNDTLMVAYMTPLEPEMEANINVYKGRNAWGDFVSYLGSNDISPGKQSGKLKVVVNNITPITESYTNDYGPSDLQGKMDNIVGDNMRQLAFATGFNGKSDIDRWKESGGAKGVAGQLLGGISGAGKAVGGMISEQAGNDLSSFLSNPAQKIDIPQMWKGNSFNCAFEISIRLFCFSPKDDNYFGDYILAPLGALMMFAAPKSEQGKFYTWPFMLKFQIPGLVDIPLGYCSSLTVVKGGDNNDLSYINRPGMIDLRMGINSVYGVRVNAADASDYGRPTILSGLEAMANLEPTEVPATTNSASGGGGNSSESTSRNAEMSQSDQEAISKLT